MTMPLYPYGLFGEETGLILGFLIGIGFGFFLERAGFGSARKLVAQFYLTDLAVFKVMFTAIVTAMLGVTYLSWLGLLDLSLVYIEATHLTPQIAGGLLLGVGFVVGGYCPGTSIAAIATGHLDGLAYVSGVLAGILGFAAGFNAMTGFYESAAMGEITLPHILSVPYGVVVFAVVVVALLGFWGAGWIERSFAEQGQ